MLGQERESCGSLDMMETVVEESALITNAEASATVEGAANIQPHAAVIELQDNLKSLETLSEKVEACLTFMETCIAEPQKPSFRCFWEARKLLLDLLHSPSLVSGDRSKYHGRCKELYREALILKDRLADMSSFAAEQIGIAIEAMKVELSKAVEVPEDWDSAVLPECLEKESSFYFETHSRLLRLSALAERLRGLREEVLSISMKGKVKRKLLDDLSEVGNVLFPEKRELSNLLGNRFLEDVNNFVQSVASGNLGGRSALQLLSEVRRFQALAKELQLTRTTFKSARMALSSCWDRLNAVVMQKRERLEERKEVSRTNFESLKLRISKIGQSYSEGGYSEEQFDSELLIVQKEMRNIDLDRDSVMNLKKMLKDVRVPLLHKRAKEIAQKKESDREASQKREECLHLLRNSLGDLLEKVLSSSENSEELSAFEEEYRGISEKCRTHLIWKSDRVTLEKLLKQIKHAIEDKNRAPLMDISQHGDESVVEIKKKLQKLVYCRDEVKDRLENHKKSIGVSGLDLERALYLGQMMQQDKDRFCELKRVITEMESLLRERVRKEE